MARRKDPEGSGHAHGHRPPYGEDQLPASMGMRRYRRARRQGIRERGHGPRRRFRTQVRAGKPPGAGWRFRAHYWHIRTRRPPPTHPCWSPMAAVHSIEQVAFTVPDLAAAEGFYAAFGLDVRRRADRLELRAFGNPHRWVSIQEEGERKRLAFVSYAFSEEDAAQFRHRIRAAGVGCEPHPLSDGSGLWLRDPDGVTTQLVVGPKVSPSHGSEGVPAAKPAPNRSQVAVVRPRHLSHALRFSSDVPRMVRFCNEILGLRLSDHSADAIAFMHSPHGSDHHLVAFAKSDAPGLHHTSWAVGSIDELGCGAE